MSDLLVRGGTDVHGAPLDLAVVGGTVAHAPGPGAPVLDATGLRVLPGLLDLQVNGAAGVDVTSEPHRLWEVGTALAAHGVTAWCPTVITSDAAAREAALHTLAGGPPAGWLGALPLGLHLEGPMISPARKGAHPEAWLAAPSPDLVAGWSRDAGVALVTLAPELPRALDVVRALAGRGVVVAVGHTDATAEQVEAAFAAGAACVTHLGNAMPPVRPREPGPVGAALASEVTCGVIADGHHLHPAFLTAAWRALGPERFLAVSDTTAALGVPDGPARLGDQDVVVAAGTVRLADGTLAGSAASVVDCLRVLRATTGCSLADAVATATSTPARLVGDATRGSLAPGCRGDLVLVDDDLRVRATVVGGRVVHRADGEVG
ncbi:N-acetylglucosamine-6-phosphate deacetylase [Nocardioides sp. SYSU D00038]|uniref:N-acetylglucosamine-6-phosphate deacetylase n=1 Tax=Nocardioides sp. SYSU D00038 TaxID=2812554 RepID=UPI0019681914|nr:N-acetylglucosamine-6-phosphate deacetylase [Nocardioides sp. SYSU D00038]